MNITTLNRMYLRFIFKFISRFVNPHLPQQAIMQQCLLTRQSKFKTMIKKYVYSKFSRSIITDHVDKISYFKHKPISKEYTIYLRRFIVIKHDIKVFASKKAASINQNYSKHKTHFDLSKSTGNDLIVYRAFFSFLAKIVSMQHQKVEQFLQKEAGVARTGIPGLRYVRNIIFES